tara:strand:- start:391 stop:504 length:114 start_codon:yes stop_codon:yes gene_type:complete
VQGGEVIVQEQNLLAVHIAARTKFKDAGGSVNYAFQI